MYATLVLYTHDTRCPYCTMVTLNYTEALPLLYFLYGFSFDSHMFAATNPQAIVFRRKYNICGPNATVHRVQKTVIKLPRWNLLVVVTLSHWMINEDILTVFFKTFTGTLLYRSVRVNFTVSFPVESCCPFVILLPTSGSKWHANKTCIRNYKTCEHFITRVKVGVRLVRNIPLNKANMTLAMFTTVVRKMMSLNGHWNKSAD